MSQRNSDVSALVAAELTCAAENVPFTPGQARACTVREVLDRVGGKWSIGILVAASHGPVRFTELERHIEGISRRMLTLTLRNLERDGLLHRHGLPDRPAQGRVHRHPDGAGALRVAGRADQLGRAAPPGHRRGADQVRRPARRLNPARGVVNATASI